MRKFALLTFVDAWRTEIRTSRASAEHGGVSFGHQHTSSCLTYQPFRNDVSSGEEQKGVFGRPKDGNVA